MTVTETLTLAAYFFVLVILGNAGKNLAQSMQQQGTGQGPGRLGRPGGTRERADSNTDPLGRPRHGLFAQFRHLA